MCRAVKCLEKAIDLELKGLVDGSSLTRFVARRATWLSIECMLFEWWTGRYKTGGRVLFTLTMCYELKIAL